MTWYLWLILFLVLCLWPLSVMVAVVIGGKLAKGEPIQLKRTPPPKPIYTNPVADNRVIAERKREQDERSANFNPR